MVEVVVSRKKAKAEEGRSRGRPSKYTEALAARICERLSAGETLIAVCRAEDMPAEATVRLWALEDRDGFSAKYTRAREIGYLHMGDELLEIADTTQEGVTIKEGERGTETRTGDMIEHRRLRVDARKWMLARALPKIYGDKLQVDATHHHDLNGISDEDIAQELLDRGAASGRDPAKRR
jgi:hypothetical protein